MRRWSLKMTYFIIICWLIIGTGCNDEKNLSDTKLSKAEWITDAFTALNNGIYPRVKAIGWWHENFDRSQLRIDSSLESLEAYRTGISNSLFLSSAHIEAKKLVAPRNGIYHAAYPDFGGTEDEVTADSITAFEALAEKAIVWAYFSNNWGNFLQFPSEAVSTIHAKGRIPFIRMMPRSTFDAGGPDPLYTMQQIIDGVYDIHLTQWAIGAKTAAIPLLVEFGAEVNGNWFSWNGQYNGGGESKAYGDPTVPDGPERFRDAYRHIIDLCRQNNVDNITWFYHVDAYGAPDTSWNAIAQYYPGDDYIDWLGLSVYGPQEPGEIMHSFYEIMDTVYPVISTMSEKPIAILEWAITELE